MALAVGQVEVDRFPLPVSVTPFGAPEGVRGQGVRFLASFLRCGCVNFQKMSRFTAIIKA
jgi:hypothetical protein